MYLITLGTGVGGGAIIGGKLFKGGQGSISEVGHMKVKSDKYKCTCGQYGCFEGLLSLKRLKIDVDELRENPDTGLKELISDDDKPLKIFQYDEEIPKQSPLRSCECMQSLPTRNNRSWWWCILCYI